MMHLINIRRWWRSRQEFVQDRRRRRYQQKSRNPRGKGWYIDPANANFLHILGYTLRLDNLWNPGYTVDFLEQQYQLLKQELLQQYPGFVLDDVILEVEAASATPLLRDPFILEELRPIVYVDQHDDSGSLQASEIHHLESTIVLAGDQVILRIVKIGYYAGYGFFVRNHPGNLNGEGLWCRSLPDPLAQVAGEPTI